MLVDCWSNFRFPKTCLISHVSSVKYKYVYQSQIKGNVIQLEKPNNYTNYFNLP